MAHVKTLPKPELAHLAELLSIYGHTRVLTALHRVFWELMADARYAPQQLVNGR